MYFEQKPCRFDLTKVKISKIEFQPAGKEYRVLLDGLRQLEISNGWYVIPVFQKSPVFSERQQDDEQGAFYDKSLQFEYHADQSVKGGLHQLSFEFSDIRITTRAGEIFHLSDGMHLYRFRFTPFDLQNEAGKLGFTCEFYTSAPFPSMLQYT